MRVGGVNVEVSLIVENGASGPKFVPVKTFRLDDKPGDVAARKWHDNLNTWRHLGLTGICNEILRRLPELRSGGFFNAPELDILSWVNKPLSLANLNPSSGEAILPENPGEVPVWKGPKGP